METTFFWPLGMTTADAVRALPVGVAMLREEGTGGPMAHAFTATTGFPDLFD